MILKNVRIVLTGGSSGIGKATAGLLAEKGAQVLITGRNEKRLKEVSTTLGCPYILADVSRGS